MIPRPESATEKSPNKRGGADGGGVQTRPSSDSSTNEDDSVEEKVKNVKNTVEALMEKRLGEELDGALDSLHERISAAIIAQRKDQENAANLNLDSEEKKKSNDAYAKLRDSAAEAYNSLVLYGSSTDLSSQGSPEDKGILFLSEVRRSRMLDIGRNLWMAIRNNPELFNDMISEDKADGGNFVSFEGKKNKAVAGGYARAIAARLVFLNYIDTRCSIGRPPVLLHASASREDCNRTPSLQELVFGLKLFSRAGRAILSHNRKDARASYDSLSLAASCFDAVSAMADSGNGEAADHLKGLFDEAFDAISMLPNAASLFGELRDGDDMDRSFNQVDGNGVCWQSLVLKCLEQVESFVDGHCNVFKMNVEDTRSTSKLATLQRFLPSLARLCYKHGSHFVKLQDYENAGKALHIALKSTNSCLSEIRQEIEQGLNRKGKGKQMLHNLEAELVVVSIEAFHLLSVSYQSSGEKEKALACLDRIEAYMKEQHDRDNELFSNVMNRLSSGEDFVFSEGGATSALEGSKTHFDKDKADIKNRAQTALEDAKKRHAAEKATLAFSRIMIFHKTMPCPSAEEESLIDQKMRELVEQSLKFTTVSSSDFGSAQHAVTAANLISSVDNKANGNDKIFDLTLQAVRLVHERRTISKISKIVSNTYTDNYKVLLGKLPKTHSRRPFVMLDRLNAMLAAEYQVRERKTDKKLVSQLDTEALQLAKEYLATVKTFLDKTTTRGNRDTDTTLFVESTQSLSNDLFEESKVHFARAVSLYHSLDAHDLCAQWSDLLQSILQLKKQVSVSLEDSDVLLGQVMTVKAYALSMSGNHASGMKTARDAWEKVKTVDSMVNLFHCSLRHELKHHSCDTMLEFDAALNELLTLSSDSVVDEVLAAFPRLSNSCVENEVSGGELLLLGVQDRWMDLLMGSKTFNRRLKEKDASEVPEFSVFDILRAYLKNYEHVISLKKDNDTTDKNFEALGRIVDGVLKLLVQVRETKLQKRSGRRKKRKSAAENNVLEGEANDAGFVLVWDDPATKKLLGDRSDCVWTAEQLWNIGNQLMAIGLDSSRARGFAADAFAASHDFCLMSEEEEGQSLSKGYLDFDVKFDPTKAMLPKFEGSHERPPCDISSEFSGQCLLISVATAVDYAADRMFGGGNNRVGSVDNDVQILLSRSLHRLAQAQEELQLNCDDEQQRSEVNKMIVLLALRCLLGVGEDSLALESLKSNGLYDALHKIHLDELPSLSQTQDGIFGTQFVTLRNVKLMSDLAEERKMHQTSRCLQRLCAQQLSDTSKFVLDIGEYEISLGDIQKDIIQSAFSAKDVIEVYEEIDALVEKHREASKKGEGGDFYSVEDLTWFAKDANNRAVQHDLLGDDNTAAKLFATALNLVPLCGQDVQCHSQSMNAAYQQVVSRIRTRGDSLSSIWNLINE